MYRTVAEAVFLHSEERPEHPAMIDRKRVYTYAQAAGRAAAIARRLSQAGLRPGDRVAVSCTQDCTFLLICLACQMGGLVFVPLEKKATPEHTADVIRQCEARCCIGADAPIPGILTLQPEGLPGDGEASGLQGYAYEFHTSQAEILFTTGTTGKPKGIVLSHQANIALAENIIHGVEMSQDAVELIPMPLSHSHGLRTCYAHLVNGSTAVLLDGVTNLGLFFEMVEKYAVNALDISPTLAKLLLKIAKRGLQKIAPKLDYIELGTAGLEDETKHALRNLFPNTRLYNFYGSTEAGRCCVLNFQAFDDTGCIGFPAVNAQVRIVDGNGCPITGTRQAPGAIAVAGAMVMEGYLNSPELTASVLREGTLYTNDLGYMDSEGRIYVLGRRDDIINYKGIKIAPEEIESVAGQYSAVTDCACVPVEDPLCGQVPMLFVCVRDAVSFDGEEMLSWLKQRLEPSRIPAQIKTVNTIPRSANGKVQRKRLRWMI